MRAGNMKIIVIADPDLSEIEEMLELVSKVHNLDDILPSVDVLKKSNMTQAEYLKSGWCYLWYDAETLKPLGYTLFAFEKTRHKERFPFFLFGATQFCEIKHILKVKKAMLNVMRNAFKNQVRAYIDTERIAKFAKAHGFLKLKKKDFIWAKAVARSTRE